MTKAEAFFEGMRGKRVSICGIGANNTPVIHQFLEAGAHVTACDRRSREQLAQPSNRWSRPALVCCWEMGTSTS